MVSFGTECACFAHDAEPSQPAAASRDPSGLNDAAAMTFASNRLEILGDIIGRAQGKGHKRECWIGRADGREGAAAHKK